MTNVFLEAFRTGPFWLQFHLMKMIPDFTILETVAQDKDYHPEGDVMRHTLEVAKVMFELCQVLGISGNHRAVLMLAAWFHDFGKIVSEVNEKGRISSNGHANRSEKMALEILPAMGVPDDIARAVAGLCREHMNHITLKNNGRSVVNMERRLAADGVELHTWLALKVADKFGRPPIPRELSGSLLESINAYKAFNLNMSGVEIAAKLLATDRNLWPDWAKRSVTLES